MASTGESGRWRQVAGVLLAEVDRIGDPAAKAAKLLEIGDVFRDHLGDPQTASRHYAESARQAPAASQGALTRLAALAREHGDATIVSHFVAALSVAERWVDVVTVLVKQAEVMPDPGERTGLFLEAAELTRTRLADPELARAYLLAAAHDAQRAQCEAVLEQLHLHLTHAPDDVEAITAAARLEVLAGRPLEAVHVLTRGAAHVRDLGAKARLLLDASTLCGDRAGMPLEAAVHAYEALVLDPGLAAAVEARLDATLARWGHVADVSATLEQIFERLGQPERVHEVLIVRLDVAAARERPGLLLRLAEQAEYRLLDPARAFELYRRGLQEQGGDPTAFAAGMRRVGAEGVAGAAEAMIDDFGRLGLWRALVNVHDGEAALAVDDAPRAEHLFRAGEILETHLDDLEGAMQRFLQAFKLQPREMRYMAAGERLYRRREDWPMVDRLLGLQVRVADEAAIRRRLLIEQGRVRHRNLGDACGAYESVRAALAEGGADAAMALLRDLVRDDTSFAEIADRLRTRAAGEGATEAARLLTELAALLIELRGETEAGLSLLREASELAPDDEALFVRVSERLEAEAGHGATEHLAAWLAGAATRPFSAPVRVAALRRAGALEAGVLARPVRARDLLRTAAALAPQDAEVCRALVLAARAAHDPLPLAEVLARIAAGQMAPLPELDHDAALRELALLYERALGDVESAADCHRTLLADRPADPVSLPWMRERLTRAEAWGELRAVLDAAAAACEREVETDRLHELWVDLAALTEARLGDVVGAAAYVHRLWSATRNPDARDALRRMYRTAGDRAGERALLAQELADVDDGHPDAARRAEELLAVASEPPAAPDLEEVALRRLAGLRPTDPAPIDALLVLLRAQARSADLIEALGVRAARSGALEAVPFLRERALERTRAGADLDAAIADWDAVLERVPDDDEALRYLQGIYASRQEHEAQIAVIERRVAAATAPEVRVALLREAAVQIELRLGDTQRATTCWERIAEVLPDDPEVMDERLRLYETDERWTEFVPLAERRLPGMEAGEAFGLAQQVARLVDGGDAAVALEAWLRVQRFAPTDVEAATGAVRQAERLQDRMVAATQLGILASLARNPIEARSLRERQARAYEAAGELSAALDALRLVNQDFPNDRETLKEMRRLAGLRQDDWTLCRVLEAELQLVSPGLERIDLEKTLARRLDEGLGEQANAALVWERVVAAAPADLDALMALRTLYADLDRPADLVRILRALLDRAEDDDERIERLVDAARLIETHRRDLAEAFECWWRAFKLTGDADPEMVREMGRLAEAAGLWDRYIRVLEVARQRATTREEQIEVLVQQSRVAEERLRSPEKARELLKAAFEIAPREGRVFDEYVRVCEAGGAWSEVLDACALLMRGVIDREVRAALLLRSAAILERHLADPERAFETYAAALKSGASEGAVLPELVRMAETHGYWDALTEQYRERWQKQTQLTARLATIHELARLLETRCGDWERAFEQYVIALQLDPEDETTRAEAWRLAEAHGAWALIIRVFELKVRDAEETWLKISLLHDVARIQERKLGQPEKAMETLRRAFSLETWNETTHAAMRRLAGELGRWQELAAAFEEEAGWSDDPHARLRLYREASTLLGENGDHAGAARILRHVVELEPNDELASTSLARLLRQTEDWEALAAHLELRAVRGLEDARIAVMHELAVVYRTPMAAPRKAEQVCARILTLRPSDATAHELLVELLEARDDVAGIIEALDARARVLPTEARGAVLRRKAELLRTRRDQPREAFRVLSRLALDVPPAEAIEIVREMAALADGNAEHEELLVAAERALGAAAGESELELLLLAGRVARDRFQNRKKARGWLARALELRPGDVAVAREVLELAAAEKRWTDVVALLVRHGPPIEAGPDMTDAAAASAWALRLSDVQAERQGDLAAAMETLRTALESCPGDAAVLSRLESVAIRAQAPESLLAAIQAQVRSAATPMQVLGLLGKGARALETLNAPELAIGLWQQLLALDPHDDSAEAAVREYAARRRDWDLLASQLVQRIQATVSPVERGALLCELAVLHRDKRQDPQAAENRFAEALVADPKSLEATEGLAALALARGDAPAIAALADRLQGRLDHRPPPIPGGGPDPVVARATPLLVQLQLFRARQSLEGGDETSALTLLRDAWRRLPDREDVGHLLAETLYREAELSEAATVYARLAGLPPVPDGVDPGLHKARESMRRARCFSAAGDVERAIRAFEAAAQEPSTRIDALEALANLQERAGHWEASIRLRERIAADADDPRIRAMAWLAAGIVAESRLGKPARAVGFYERALQEGLDDHALLTRLLPIFREQQRSEQALGIAQRLLVRETDPNARADLFCAVGDLRQRAGRADEAHLAFRSAVELSPLHALAVRGALATLAAAPPAPDEADTAAVVLRSLWQGITGVGGRERGPALDALGAALVARGDTAGALEVFEELHAILPDHLGAQRQLAELYGRLATQAVADPDDSRHFERAIRHRTAYLRAVPAEPGSLRDLVALYRGAGRSHWAVTPLRLLNLIREATREEAELARSLGGPLDDRQGLVLDAVTRGELIADPEWKNATAVFLRTLWAAVGEPLDALLSGQVEPVEPAQVQAPHVVDLVAGLCDALELPRCPLWVRAAPTQRVEAMQLFPLELVVDAGLLQGTNPRDLRFQFARALEGMRDHHLLLNGLGWEDARALFAAAMAVALGEDGPEYAIRTGAEAERIEFWADFLVENLDASVIEALSACAGPVSALGPRAFELWAQATRKLANRTAFVLTGDLGRAVALLQREDEAVRTLRVKGADGFVALMEANAEVADVYRYAFGTRFHALLGALR
jgi:tetratricopeptide (TPR) repeat protein